MTHTLPSYIKDAWWTPSEADLAQTPAAEVRDAVTGEVVTHVSSAGLDLAGAMAFARETGQAALGALTFHQRAVLLKHFALTLTERKAELYELSTKTGATKSDSWVDIDGGIGVLFTYSGKGRRELPNAKVQLDGPVEPLSKDGSFLGRHIRTTLPGVAVQINAFNFPVWGALEKLAPTFLAGMPTIIKPATPGAYLTEHMVRILVESGLLPAGAIQLVSGSIRDVFTHAKLGDVVAFTGSASTAAGLRLHPAVQTGGVIFGAETDSINASVLGPDAAPGTPEFDAYVRQLVTEMTSKAGQKCTAIRRAIVPAELADAVADAVIERVAARVVVGDPRDEGTTMGALASTEQRTEVLRQVQRLVDGGGRIVHGAGQDPDGGTAFVTPILLRFDDPRAERVHDTEAFGPVSSIIGYNSPDEAAELVSLGGGSLVTSVASADPEFVARLTRRIASGNGRVLTLDRTSSRASTGHGSPLPNLVHGGPGRAGGSEELGGVRSAFHYMQRTAIQGSPEMLTAITGVWHAGAATQGDVHPFRKSLQELRIGDQIISEPREVTLADITHFAEFTGDTFYAHTDEEAAAANPFFPGRVAHGYLLLSFAAGLFVSPEPGPVLANYGLESLRFITPVSPGDRVRVALTAKQIVPRETDEYGEVHWDAVLTNQNDEVVATYDVLTLVSKTPELAEA
ncbi:oxepin-CoA hydrolase/3-oxo-5,6-dehydrosuberyl-CoA semialdehyde dehydrogenase [Leucobacter luti]|uniref:phenylacetic acid degradation bifunctional protein PaaZ n=1 Tax=Leucobacter luti TaxID=340320 RepID=UPI00104FD57C|nr:phenylacetic acid degradation bifunctional protein PaaZ [Leucobacter luti]MCW2287140.1 oxepin-CoA hydrolase/3-oxo-5,6-dehydrosuberyl-CoA semialdehyde dehydrogenase [Leucobacter luti]TCK41366.1 oxepin-CoA hydrolase/3-oxo-5,6-dehydrosuberyl-CoA semialdehyde dehydrogenase [Leucobacter luti]